MQSLRSKNMNCFDLGFRALIQFKSCGLLVAGPITRDKRYAQQQFEERFGMLPVFSEIFPRRPLKKPGLQTLRHSECWVQTI